MIECRMRLWRPLDRRGQDRARAFGRGSDQVEQVETGVIHRFILCIAAAALVAGCATPVAYTDRPGTAYDKDTEYIVEDTPGGFVLTVNYSRYQFIPESTAVQTSCRSQLTSIAHELAEKRGRKIQPIDEQRIKISMGRNGFSGITSCSANVAARYAAS